MAQPNNNISNAVSVPENGANKDGLPKGKGKGGVWRCKGTGALDSEGKGKEDNRDPAYVFDLVRPALPFGLMLACGANSNYYYGPPPSPPLIDPFWPCLFDLGWRSGSREPASSYYDDDTEEDAWLSATEGSALSLTLRFWPTARDQYVMHALGRLGVGCTRPEFLEFLNRMLPYCDRDLKSAILLAYHKWMFFNRPEVPGFPSNATRKKKQRRWPRRRGKDAGS